MLGTVSLVGRGIDNFIEVTSGSVFAPQKTASPLESIFRRKLPVYPLRRNLYENRGPWLTSRQSKLETAWMSNRTTANPQLHGCWRLAPGGRS